MAVRVYPNPQPEVSVRRFLLENVLLLASRRLAHVEDAGAKDEKAVAAIKETYCKSLQNIFKYYVDRADKRRSQTLAAEAIKRGFTGSDKSAIPGAEAHAQKAQEFLRAQKDLISYKEYIQFCHDFDLKSTSLLTAIQVGEVFFNCVALDAESKTIKGMNFDAFCATLIHMALLAYRNCHPSVTPVNKIKALLCFMWRAVNQSDKRERTAKMRGQSSTSHAGSLNMFGAGHFADFYLETWQKEGFPDYTSPSEESAAVGRIVLSHLTGESTEGEGGGAGEAAEDGGDASTAGEKNTRRPGTRRASSAPMLPAEETKDDKAGAKQITLHGFQLAALFRCRPELAEMIFLEIKTMKYKTSENQTPISDLTHF